MFREQLSRVPPDVWSDPRTFAHLMDTNSRLKADLENRKHDLESLERHVGESNSKRSALIQKLENDLAQKRFAIKDMVESLQKEISRLRRDRDQMRELYEATNMQVASLSKQNTHLQTLIGQLNVHL